MATSLAPILNHALKYRSIGPYRGGRVVAVAGHPAAPQSYYFGSTGGGVWKTEDGGITWGNISDGFFQRASVGALAVAQSDPNVIYAGMGETTIRSNVTLGDGVYKSTDGGATWKHLGLAGSQQIAKIRIHPTDPNTVYVAAFGHIFGPNQERGLYRSTDGGKRWEQILFRSEQAGAIDLAMDPSNPRILYAAFWEAHRTPHSLVSGGPGSSIYKSLDGGDTWVELTDRPGLPRGVKGKIGIAVSPARPSRVWALVEAEDGGLFRSDDAGATWVRISEDRTLRLRAWYYMHVIADPQDPDTVYVPNVQFWKSIDGGRTFASLATPHPDHHDLWIDPANPQRMIHGADGGAAVSGNGGFSWTSVYNQPTVEFYHVTTDSQFPYRVYGAQQDNTTISVPSRSAKGVITQAEYYDVGGGESGYIAVHPDDANIVYAGSYQGLVTRYDHRTQRAWDISPYPELGSGEAAGAVKYRFQWTFPIALSPHDPNLLYVAGNVLFRSADEGASWDVISPDLTRNDPSTLGPSGGPITGDNTGAEYYGTIFAFAESPIRQALLWAGSDDGLIHLSRDGGEQWANVTPQGLPEWALISIIEPSPHDADTCYVAATRYKLDDPRPYLFKTTDGGKNWALITTGIPETSFTRVIREDVVRPGLLFAGTETGMFVSQDAGASWQPLQLNLPVTPIHDFVIKDADLVVATHGRGFWILDDITPLRQVGDVAPAAAVHLFPPSPAYRVRMESTVYYKEAGTKQYVTVGAHVTPVRQVNGVSTPLEAGQNSADGVPVYYVLGEKPAGEVTLRFLDGQGQLIIDLSTGKEKGPSANAGLNRFVWDMRCPEVKEVPGVIQRVGSLSGPMVAPGTYQVQLLVGGESQTRSFEIRKDPRIAATDSDLQEQFDLLMAIRTKLAETNGAAVQLRDVREQVQGWVRRSEGLPSAEAIAKAAEALLLRLSAIEDELVQHRPKVKSDFLHYGVRLNNKLAALAQSVGSAERAPSRQARTIFADLAGRVDSQVEQLKSVIRKELTAFEGLLRESNVPLVRVPAGD